MRVLLTMMRPEPMVNAPNQPSVASFSRSSAHTAALHTLSRPKNVSSDSLSI